MSAGRPGRNRGASCSRVARIRFRRNARAVLVGIRRETRGQAAAQPQPVHRFRRRPGDRLHLADIERTQVEVLDAPGQALGLSQPLPRGRTEGQEASGPETPAAPVVPEAAQLGEDPRQAVDLVENGQPLFVGPKEPRQVRHADAVLGQLEVDDDPADLLGDRPRQGGLARLPRPEQTHGGLPAQRDPDSVGSAASEHTYESQAKLGICMFIRREIGSPRAITGGRTAAGGPPVPGNSG